MFNLTKYSRENLVRIKNAMKIVLDEFELRGKNHRKGIEVTQKQLEEVGLYKDEFLSILRKLNTDGIGNFRIFNDIPNFSRMDIGDKENVFFKIINPDFVSKFQNTHKTIVRYIMTKKVKKADDIYITRKPRNWGWLNKKDGEYQFGKKPFKQVGDKVRKGVFQSLMDIFELSPQAISIKSMREQTNISAYRLRIEIVAINKRLSVKIGILFKGSGKGFYRIKKLSNYLQE